MNLRNSGDKSKCLCSICDNFTMATFKVRDVPFSDGSGIVNNILAGVCDVCDSVACIPHQETLKVKEALDLIRQAAADTAGLVSPQ
jgi:hypothetical protein